jgi:LmbE family N-acetylglucosaminyl deacetylase
VTVDARAWLRAAERDLPLVAGLDPLLGPAGGVLVVAPHPDDESLGCGGLLAACAEAGRAARVLVVSDGAASHPGSRAWPPPRLAARRREEARAAVAALGLDPGRDIAFLGLPDAAVPTGGARFDAALDAALGIALPAPPAAVVAAWRHDPHRDHAAAFVLARALVRALPVGGARLLEYPVWGLAYAHPGPGFPLPEPAPRLPGPPRGLRLDVVRHLPAKRRAVAAHASQLGGLVEDSPGAFLLPDSLLALAFRPFELFLESDP